MGRNIFSDQKYVEEYHTKDIEEGLGISREQLVYMALLLGSDYTEGIAGAVSWTLQIVAPNSSSFQ